MGDSAEEQDQLQEIFPATVSHIIDKYRIVINRGALDDVHEGQRFLVYEVRAEEIRDPVTGESLGHLELVKGTGKVTHVQEHLSTIASDRKQESGKTTVRRSPFLGLSGPHVETIEPARTIPFFDPEIGDKAKPI